MDGGEEMYDGEKFSRSLRAIDRNAKRKQAAILEEMEELEKKELEKAEAEIIEDVKVILRREINGIKNKISVEVSHKELDRRKMIDHKRQSMLKSIFKEGQQRLIEFTKTQEYRDSLIIYTKNIANRLKNDDVILYVYENDLKYEQMVKEAFGRKCQIKPDKSIRIGGIRGYSKSEGVIADETIDSKLIAQEEWFLEKYGNSLIQDFLKRA